MKPILALPLLAGLAVHSAAQTWSSVTTTSPLFVGKLVSDTNGVVCFDDQAVVTRLFNGTWTTITPTVSPPARALSSVTSSSLTATPVRAFLFGGLDTTSTGLLENDVWRFDRAANTWVQIQATGVLTGPTPRVLHASAGLVSGFVTFGGTTSTSTFANDGWLAVVGGGAPAWFPITTPATMPGRRQHGMAEGPNRTVVLFGGEGASGLLADTWVFDLTTGWVQVTGAGPSARLVPRMTYDPDRDMVVLRGGIDASGTFINDNWEFNGFFWRQVPATGGAPADAIAFDTATGSRKVTAIAQRIPTLTDTSVFTPSPASFASTLDVVCNAGSGFMNLTAVQRSLPISGGTLAMQIDHLTASSLAFGAFELTPAAGPFSGPLAGCSVCSQGVTMGSQTATQTLAPSGGVANWNLPVSNSPALLGQSVEMQGFVVDGGNPPTHPCFVMTTNRCTGVVGL